MSNASAAILFPDGEIRYGIYHGTSDLMYPALFDTIDEAWDNNRTDRMDERGAGQQQVFPVVIYSDYGGGFYWNGTATRTDIIDGIDGWDDDHPRTDGHPPWLTWKHQKALES